MSDLVVESASDSESSGLKKTAVIRGFLQGLIDRGELDLFRPVSNSTLRGWAEELKAKYGQDFNINTISSVLRDLRLLNSYKLTGDIGSESEVKSESVESEGASSPEPSGVGSASESSGGSGGDAVTSWLFLAGLGALFALGVFASYYLSQNK